MRTTANSLFAVAALVVSVGTLIQDFSEQLNVDEALISGATALFIALVGVWSVYVARFAKRLPVRPRIFLSYSRKDAEPASKLKEAMSKNGALVSSWETELEIGGSLTAAVESAIESSNSVVLIVSGDLSPNLKAEFGVAQARKVPVLIVTADREPAVSDPTVKHVFRVDSTHPNFDAIATQLIKATEGHNPSKVVV